MTLALVVDVVAELFVEAAAADWLETLLAVVFAREGSGLGAAVTVAVTILVAVVLERVGFCSYNIVIDLKEQSSAVELGSPPGPMVQ